MGINAVIDRLERDDAYLKAHWCLPAEEARLLHLLVRVGGFRKLLEVGTSIGYSGLHLAQAVSANHGQLITIDASAERQAEALRHFEEAGLSPFVQLVCGDALMVLASLESRGEQFDFMFIDARKSQYSQYLACAERLLAPGGLLVADNTRSHREKMLDFIHTVQASPLWEVCDLETPTGLVLARKL